MARINSYQFNSGDSIPLMLTPIQDDVALGFSGYSAGVAIDGAHGIEAWFNVLKKNGDYAISSDGLELSHINLFRATTTEESDLAGGVASAVYTILTGLTPDTTTVYVVDFYYAPPSTSPATSDPRLMDRKEITVNVLANPIAKTFDD